MRVIDNINYAVFGKHTAVIGSYYLSLLLKRKPSEPEEADFLAERRPIPSGADAASNRPTDSF
jgi:hypothetical protein